MNSGPVIRHRRSARRDPWWRGRATVNGGNGKAENCMPSSDLEKQAILAAIAQLHGDKL